jgi:ABC-type multidrug transport system ATPase subunit
MLVAITGASGSGKSTLVNEILFKALWKKLVDTRTLPGKHERVDGMDYVHRVVNIDQTPIGRNSRSNPATYIGFYDAIRDLFTGAPLSLERDYKAGRFSFNVKGGRCEECQGEGVITTQLYFMPDVEVMCGACKGARFNSETLEVTLRGKTIDDVLNMSIEEGITFFAADPAIGKKIEVLNDLGLGYLTLGQSATTLSGGEAQRVKIAAELGKLQRGKHTLYILDEPTTGLHLADVERLLDSLNRLVDAGHTVLLIEHHLDVIKTADYVIDLGPEGGHAGGEVVATGSPEDVAACAKSHTGRFLKEVLRRTPVVQSAKREPDRAKPQETVRRVEETPEPPRPVSAKKPALRQKKEPVTAPPPSPNVKPVRAAARAPSVPPQTFKAVITLSGTRAIITLPFDPNKAWGNRARHYASGTIDGHLYRGMLEPAGIGFFLSLGPAWRRDNELDAGATVEVVLYPDGLQILDLSPDISQAMQSEPDALKRFESLPSGYRKNMIGWIENAKRPETRAARLKRVMRFLKTAPTT